MTSDEYRAILKSWGLAVRGPVIGKNIMHQTRDGQLSFVADPEQLTPDERLAALDMLSKRLGFDWVAPPATSH